jgi:hypothetical protein
MWVNQFHQGLEQRTLTGLLITPRRIYLSGMFTAVSCVDVIDFLRMGNKRRERLR